MTHEELIRTIRMLEAQERMIGLKPEESAKLEEAREALVVLGPKGGPDAVVVCLKDFRAKWGTRLPGLLIERFIRAAPEFEGDLEMARSIGILLADLESVQD